LIIPARNIIFFPGFFLIDKTGQTQSTQLKNDTRRTRLDLTVPASTHRGNHITATSFQTNKTHLIHNRNPNSKNRNEIPKAGDAKLLLAFTPRRLEPTTAKLKKLSPPRNKSRRRRSCGNLHLPESKPTLRASLPRHNL
ncbi:hypothetical protein HID58_058119, partial [Brassica napus]